MSQKPSILIVEDEPSILRGLTDLFVFHGFDVESRMDGKEGLEQALTGRYDCVILDVMLPSMNGFDICNAIRQQSESQGILMLTAKNAEEDIINGLTLGADDYLAKPFSTSELVLRAKALVRRSSFQKLDGKIRINADVSICINSLTGVSYAQEQRYTSREVAILNYLRTKGIPVPRNELLKEIWGYKSTDDLDTRTVDIHIAKIRKKIEKDPKLPRCLVTHRGEGYQLFCEKIPK